MVQMLNFICNIYKMYVVMCRSSKLVLKKIISLKSLATSHMTIETKHSVCFASHRYTITHKNKYFICICIMKLFLLLLICISNNPNVIYSNRFYEGIQINKVFYIKLEN